MSLSPLSIFPLMAASWLQASMGRNSCVSFMASNIFVLVPNNIATPIEGASTTPAILVSLVEKVPDWNELIMQARQSYHSHSLELVLPNPDLKTRKELRAAGMSRMEASKALTLPIDSAMHLGESSSAEVELQNVTESRLHHWMEIQNIAFAQLADDPVVKEDILRMTNNRLNNESTSLFLIQENGYDVGVCGLHDLNPNAFHSGDNRESPERHITEGLVQKMMASSGLDVEGLKPTAFVFDLLIDQRRRGQGIATKAIDKLKAKALSRGILQLGVFANTELESFYENIGFRAEQSIERWYLRS